MYPLVDVRRTVITSYFFSDWLQFERQSTVLLLSSQFSMKSFSSLILTAFVCFDSFFVGGGEDLDYFSKVMWRRGGGGGWKSKERFSTITIIIMCQALFLSFFFNLSVACYHIFQPRLFCIPTCLSSRMASL